MPLDGYTLRFLTNEISEVITGARVDKIYQPSRNEVVMALRGQGIKNLSLVMSADPSLPFMTLSSSRSENPSEPPMFTMLLRKHLSGAKVDSIRQYGLERVVVIDFTGRSEMGDETSMSLVIEIMGKHSNIIFIDSRTNRVIDSVKRVPEFLSKIRPILPGYEFSFIPSDRISLLDMNVEEAKKRVISRLEEMMSKGSADVDLRKAIYSTFEGMSPSIAEFALRSRRLDVVVSRNELKWPGATDDIASAIVGSMSMLKDRLEKGESSPSVFRDGTDSSLIDFSIFSDYVPVKESLTHARIITEAMPSVAETVETFYMKRHRELKLKARAQSMRRTVASRIEQLRAKVCKLNDELVTSENADEYKMTGDLILANAYSIEKGMHSATVHNYYAEGYETVEIKLDVRLSPNENAQYYYKKYNKLKSARINIEKHLEDAAEEIEYLENVLTSIDCSEDYQNIDEIVMELYESNIIRKRPPGRKKGQKPSPPLMYMTSTGYEVVAGKNNLQNDRLTLKESSKGDLWFHTKDIPGSHVILRTGGKDVDDATIIEAAMIAAWNSKGRHSGQVPVDYTPVKHVKKPSGAKPGKVIYTHNRTVYVTSTEEEIEKMKVK